MELRTQHSAAERRQSIVAASLVAEIGRRSLVGLGDETIVGEALDDAVQIAGVEGDQAIGSCGDLLHEAVAVALRLGERKEELEVDRLERKEIARVAGHIVQLTIRWPAARVSNDGTENKRGGELPALKPPAASLTATGRHRPESGRLAGVGAERLFVD